MSGYTQELRDWYFGAWHDLTTLRHALWVRWLRDNRYDVEGKGTPPHIAAVSAVMDAMREVHDRHEREFRKGVGK